MIPYKSKLIPVEDGILNVSPTRNKRNSYPMKETPVVMKQVKFFNMTSTWMTPSFLRIQILAEISFWKAETWYYLIYTLVYTLEMQNMGYNKEKQKRSQISPFTKLLKVLSLETFWRLLMLK